MFHTLPGLSLIDGSNDDRDDMVLVPQNVWDVEKSYNTSNSNIRQISDHMLDACMSIKVVYNNGWVQSAGRGNRKLALKRIYDVFTETKLIYGDTYSQGNRLGIDFKINIVGGNKFKI